MWRAFPRGWLIAACCSLCGALPALAAEPLRLVSGDWHPYVDESRITDAERLVENLLELDNDSVEWRYPGFYFAAWQLRTGMADAGFPFFRTDARAEEFLFSDPLFQVNNVLVYNRRRHDLADAPQSMDVTFWADFEIGVVAGYSYESFLPAAGPRVTEFRSEQRALAALLQGEIDLLPVERNVWRSLAMRYYPDRYYLLAEAPGIGWPENVHLIMPATPQGRARMTQFNERLARFRREGQDIGFDYSTGALADEIDRGTARLVTTPLRPVIKGRTVTAGDAPATIVIPEGTSALVVDWADEYFEFAEDASVVRLLQAESRVLLLDGPHIGTEVYVENLHIHIK